MIVHFLAILSLWVLTPVATATKAAVSAIPFSDARPALQNSYPHRIQPSPFPRPAIARPYSRQLIPRPFLRIPFQDPIQNT